MVIGMRPGKSIYSAGDFYDELMARDGAPRPHAAKLADYFSNMQPDELIARQRAVDKTIVDMGISFTVYSEGDNIDRAWPFDIIPRVIDGQEWDRVSLGLQQRLIAAQTVLGPRIVSVVFVHRLRLDLPADFPDMVKPE